jgi:hypothetical protein
MDHARRKAKLESLLARVRYGGTVQNRDLSTWLSADIYADYLDECRQQSELRKDLKRKPTQIVEYEARLKRALFVYNKAEGASAKGKSAAARKHYHNAETLFERTLEYLQEIVEADQALCVWFDRDTNWSASSEAGIDPVSIPRVVTSRSLDSRGGGLLALLQSKADLKITALEREIEQLAGEEELPNTEDEKAALKARIKRFNQLHGSD